MSIIFSNKKSDNLFSTVGECHWRASIISDKSWVVSRGRGNGEQQQRCEHCVSTHLEGRARQHGATGLLGQEPPGCNHPFSGSITHNFTLWGGGIIVPYILCRFPCREKGLRASSRRCHFVNPPFSIALFLAPI